MTKTSTEFVRTSLSRSLKKKRKWKVSSQEVSPIDGTFKKTDGSTPQWTPPATKEKKPPSSLHYHQLFRYSTRSDRILIGLSILFVTISAIGLPIVIIMYGEYSTLLIDRTVGVGTSTETIFMKAFGGGAILTNATKEENRQALINDSEAFSIGCLIVTVFSIITCAVGVDLMNYTAIKQIGRIRKLFFEAIIKQDMEWFDLSTSTNFATKITDDLEKIKEGIGEKFGIFTYLVMTFTISIACSIAYGWKLALVTITCAPLIVASTAFVTKMQSSLSEKELKSYSIAGAVAEEVLSGIRTVVSFSGQHVECDRFRERLKPAEESGNKKGIFTGLGSGSMWFIIYACYSLVFWYGIKLIVEDRANLVKEYTPAILIIVLFGVISGAQNLGFTSPLLETFAAACGAGVSVFSIIDRKPTINPMETSGLKPDSVTGNIDFENIHFRYPSRKDIPVLCGLSLKVKAGQTVAFVGTSGCGKSTSLQLLQRLYDPDEGSIRLDGNKINELNTSWLRSQIGVVGQEPVLFATSIEENIRYGNPNATNEEIIEASKSANCHSFISKLPDGYATLVGERGTHLSGGQKQRIAIARAIVRNPKILLLDEATSALDSTSEKVVQMALEKAAKGRTTLVVSHRLSTITNSDQIVFVRDGVVKEIGTHSELMAKEGLYHELVKLTQSGDLDKEPTFIKEKRGVLRQISDVSVTSIGSKKDTKEEEGLEEDDEVEGKVKRLTFLEVLKMNKPEWKVLVVGSIAAILHGASIPVYSIFFGEFYRILGEDDSERVLEESNKYSLIFLFFGLAVFIVVFIQTYMFNIAAVKLTSRLRQTSFKAMLSQEMGWFDDDKNSTGQLCARLAGDCAAVQGAAGTRLGAIFQSFSTLIIGILISLFMSWDLTLVSMIFVPVVLGSAIFEARYTEKSNLSEKQAIESGAKIAIEAIANIRTVASLGQEPHVLQRFVVEIDKAQVACHKKSRLRGFVYGFGQSSPFLAYVVAFYYGGLKVANEEIHYKTLIVITEILIFGTWVLGQALAYAPNLSGAVLSASRIVNLLNRVPKHGDFGQKTNIEIKPNSEASIIYKDVFFRYPTRPEVPVLQGLNLDILEGKTIALVGQSGCGKSTCMQLLLRFYDPDSGNVELDGVATTDYSLDQLRKQLGLVSQEPTLFDRTIAENIAYGDNTREIPMADIIEAAKKANIHEFITNLVAGYETRLGSNGAQLSGGQKQRIAIARALVRNPRILLLDEATSALDTHSEKVVQEALDAARSGRTCIMIAHRMTTVKNASLICVVKDGVIIEKGTHQELMRLGKVYAKLYSMQEVT